MRPLIRWAGSKKQAVGRLSVFWPGRPARYIEPFAGSACLFFHIQPHDAILGDLNLELIRSLRAVQRYPSQVLRSLEALPTGKRAYYRVRAADSARLGEIELAARFLYLNARCFNGLYRANSTGRFNVPYRPPTRRVVIDRGSLFSTSRALRNALLMHADFQTTCARARRGDFVYLDPPYIVERRRVFSEYLPHSFNRTDLPRLEMTLRQLDSRGVQFVVTYADSKEARRLFRPWRTLRIVTRRNIAGFTGHRRRSHELLATNLPILRERPCRQK